MKNKILVIAIISIICFLISPIAFGARVSNFFFNQSGDNLLLTDNNWELGSNTDRIVKIWMTDADISGAFTLGGTVGSGGVDMNGQELILDADADTKIVADTDDRVDFDIGGATSTIYFTSTDAYFSIVHCDSAETDIFFVKDTMGIGTSTVSGDLHVLKTASTTVYIGDATHSGCIVMGDSDDAGVTYVTALNGALVATTTKPAVCQ